MHTSSNGRVPFDHPKQSGRPATGGRAPNRRSTRRDVLKRMIQLSAGAFAASLSLPVLAARPLELERQEIAAGDQLVYAASDAAGRLLKAADLPPGSAVQAFPKGKTDNPNNLIQIVRLGPGSGSERLVAFSAICTHLGCAVSAKLDAQGLIGCPCHNSRFDPADRAAVLGGPAPRPLPTLPVTLDSDGTLVAAGSFDGPVGSG